MLGTIKKLYDTVKEDKNGVKRVTALVDTMGDTVSMAVKLDAHKVGDPIEWHLIQYFDKEANRVKMFIKVCE